MNGVSNMKYGEIAISQNVLEKWENPYIESDYLIEIEFPEFTTMCPRSGYPDFATIKIKYVPDQTIVELKSLKLYLNEFRNGYYSHELALKTISQDLISLLSPRYMSIVCDFNIRGGTKTVVRWDSDGNYKSQT